MQTDDGCVIDFSMASKLAFAALFLILLPAQAGAHVLFDGAPEGMMAEASRGWHIVWNTGAWLLALGLMAVFPKSQPRPANGLREGTGFSVDFGAAGMGLPSEGRCQRSVR